MFFFEQDITTLGALVKYKFGTRESGLGPSPNLLLHLFLCAILTLPLSKDPCFNSINFKAGQTLFTIGYKTMAKPWRAKLIKIPGSCGLLTVKSFIWSFH